MDGGRREIASAAHAADHLLNVGDRRIGQDAVAEIEDERPIREGGKYRIHGAIEHRRCRPLR